MNFFFINLKPWRIIFQLKKNKVKNKQIIKLNDTRNYLKYFLKIYLHMLIDFELLII